MDYKPPPDVVLFVSAVILLHCIKYKNIRGNQRLILICGLNNYAYQCKGCINLNYSNLGAFSTHFVLT